jgi:hypothetical protein
MPVVAGGDVVVAVEDRFVRRVEEVEVIGDAEVLGTLDSVVLPVVLAKLLWLPFIKLESMSASVVDVVVVVVVGGFVWNADLTQESPTCLKGELHWQRPNKFGIKKSQWLSAVHKRQCALL